MKKKSATQKAIQKIDQAGILLVFPILNRKVPDSLWNQLHPRTKMRWEWDSGGDNRVASLWYLMKELSDTGAVVYSKWYQGRATFFSREVFTALLSLAQKADLSPLSRSAELLYDTLVENSPLSTKQLKRLTELQGKDNEPAYNKAMKELFSRFLIVAYGEVDDGAFPSLAVGATKTLYEDLWKAAEEMTSAQAHKLIQQYLPEGQLFRKFLSKAVPLSLV